MWCGGEYILLGHRLWRFLLFKKCSVFKRLSMIFATLSKGERVRFYLSVRQGSLNTAQRHLQMPSQSHVRLETRSSKCFAYVYFLDWMTSDSSFFWVLRDEGSWVTFLWGSTWFVFLLSFSSGCRYSASEHSHCRLEPYSFRSEISYLPFGFGICGVMNKDELLIICYKLDTLKKHKLRISLRITMMPSPPLQQFTMSVNFFKT